MMAGSFDNIIRFNAASAGTADFVVASAPAGSITPAQANGTDGKTYRYFARSLDGAVWEWGSGVYVAATQTITRATISSTSNGNLAKIDFAAAPIVDVFPSPAPTLEPPPATVVRYDTAQSLTTAQRLLAQGNIGIGRNYIVNGAMMISQENGAVAGTTSSYYPVDQFFAGFSNGGACSVAQVASLTPAGSPNRLRYTVTAADAAVAAGDVAYIAQRIEGARVADLMFGAAAAKTVTLRFGCKGPAGTYCVTLLNSATNRSYVAEYVIAVSEANTDVVKTVTIPGDISGTWLVTNGIGIEVRWGLMCGATFQQAAGSWGTGNASGSASQLNVMGTNGNVFELFDVGLYQGTQAPPPAVPPYAAEYAVCQRYYYKWFGGAVGLINDTTIVQVAIQHPVPMRAAPTVAGTSALGTINWSGASNVNPSSGSVSPINATTTAAEFRLNNYTGLTVGQAAVVQPQGSALVTLSARL